MRGKRGLRLRIWRSNIRRRRSRHSGGHDVGNCRADPLVRAGHPGPALRPATSAPCDPQEADRGVRRGPGGPPYTHKPDGGHMTFNQITRRTFLASAAALPALAEAPPKKIAIISTIFRLQSHAQHIGDRFIVGYPFAGEWHKPNTQVVSLYVDQKPAGDLSEARAKEFGFKVYSTIAGAVCCGGPKLSVDAVLIIGEHGEYPRNEKGQILYPRFEFFQQVAKVFESSGRSVPVYNDKHLS